MDVGEQVTHSNLMEHINKVFTVRVLHADHGENIHAFTNCMPLHCLDLWDLLPVRCQLFTALVWWWCVCALSDLNSRSQPVRFPYQTYFFPLPVWALSGWSLRFIVLHSSDCSREIRGRF